MLNKKIYAVMLAGAVLMGQIFPVMAQQADSSTIKYEVDQAAETLTVSGIAGKGKEVSINVIKPHKTIADLNEAAEAAVQGGANGLSDVLAYSEQKRTSNTGGFEFVIGMPVNGAYTVYVDYENNTETEPKTVLYASEGDNIKALEELLASTDKNIEEVLADNWNDLMFEHELYPQLSQSKTADKFYNLMVETPFTADAAGILPSREIFKKACIMQAIQEGEGDITENLSTFDIADDSKLAAYNKRTNQDLTAAIRDNMKSQTFNDKESYEEALKLATALAVVQYPDGVSDIMNVITEFQTELGIASPSTSASDYTSLAGNKYSTVDELVSAYNSAVSSNNNSYVGGGSSGSGGSGGSGSRYNGGLGSVIGVVDNKENTTTPIPTVTEVFTDLNEAAWAKDAIMSLYRKNIVAGMTNNTFGPNQPLTREQFAKMLVNAFNLTAGDIELPFSDVKSDDWFYDSVKAAYANGIASGMGDTFGIGLQITRQDMAVMTLNAIKRASITLPDGEVTAFTDQNEISDYAVEAVGLLRAAGIINGFDDGSFRPMGVNTRAQAAVVINAILNL